jgi:hypothetical protein
VAAAASWALARVVQCQAAEAGGERGSAAEGDAVLRAEHRRRQASGGQRLVGRQDAPAGLDLALADQRQAEMREDAEVAGSDRAD